MRGACRPLLGGRAGSRPARGPGAGGAAHLGRAHLAVRCVPAGRPRARGAGPPRRRIRRRARGRPGTSPRAGEEAPLQGLPIARAARFRPKGPAPGSRSRRSAERRFGRLRRLEQHKHRLLLFFSAMRHFRDELRERGFHVHRETFGKHGAPEIKAPRSFRWDDTTKAVAALVEEHFPESPGTTEGFDLPVTARQARAALRDFVEHRLEGFVRQVLGWREYVRGIYWREMPEYEGSNGLDAELPMPAFMWTAETEMNCIRQSVGQLIDHAYAHHIQRLMVLGLFCLLLGVEPKDVNRWHLSMYADAIDWVSLPNVLGMSQYADGGLLATKPYCASGAYVQRMSDYCSGCRFDPEDRRPERMRARSRPSTGISCPGTDSRLRGNQRMDFQLEEPRPEVELRAARRAPAGERPHVTMKLRIESPKNSRRS